MKTNLKSQAEILVQELVLSFQENLNDISLSEAISDDADMITELHVIRAVRKIFWQPSKYMSQELSDQLID